jgi:FkbM family methyltransferase
MIREDDVDGEKDWHWVRDDENAWLGPKDDWINSHKERYFEHVKKFDVVITAGANHGLHCRFYAKKFKMVYAFEPNPLAFHALCLNTPYSNVFKFNAALSEKPGVVMIGGDDRATGMWSIQEHPNPRTVYAPCLTIDHLGLEHCDLIQLDVEGHEQFVVLGASETIKRFKPIVITENGNALRPIMEDILGYESISQSVSDMIWRPKIV